MVYFYFKSRILHLIYIFFLIHQNESLYQTGVWESKENFFHFLAKFGFQQTSQHEIENSKGYIYGNITKFTNNSINTFATLALLPHHYFVPFYKNSSYTVANADTICQSMFQNIEEEAFDPLCHRDGKEDFLRKIPCLKGKLCPDEDKPKNVIPEMQFTFSVQDLNNPGFWYLSFVACRRNASCLWEHVKEPLEIEYDLYIVNGKPNIGRINPFDHQFSFEKQNIVQLFLFCVLYYCCILVPVQVYAACKQSHPITRFFLSTLLIHFAGLLLNTMHYFIFAFNGVGVNILNIIGDLCNIASQSLFMMLLLLMSKGWAVTRLRITKHFLLVILWLTYTLLIFLLYFWIKTEVDIISVEDKYQTWPGWLAVVLRIVIIIWFLFELRATMKVERHAKKLNFFLQFGAASLLWFVYMPVIALIALQIAPLWRFKIILGFSYCADLLAHSFMAYALWPRRSEQYLILANELDLSDELAALDEAPQMNRERAKAQAVLHNTEGQTYFHLSDTYDSEDEEEEWSIIDKDNLINVREKI